MKKNLSLMAPCFTVLCLGLAAEARAYDLMSDTPSYHSEDLKSAATTTSSETMPARYNRASSIIGMEVRNQSDEHLGRIKDVVFDLSTERVSYAVLSTKPKGILSLSEKLLAVPLNALTASSDGQRLILNADKSQIETAMGFDQSHWPSVSNPTWGAEPFWQKKTSENPVSSPSMTEPTGTENTDPEAAPAEDNDSDTVALHVAPRVLSPALDRTPGGLAWPGY